MSRINKTAYQDKVLTRDRKRASRLMHMLYQCATGEKDMTANQIRAAEVALRKLRPDLKQIEHTGTTTVRHEHEMSLDELNERIAELTVRAAREAQAGAGAVGADPVH